LLVAAGIQTGAAAADRRRAGASWGTTMAALADSVGIRVGTVALAGRIDG
jgi:hypothetical protein